MTIRNAAIAAVLGTVVAVSSPLALNNFYIGNSLTDCIHYGEFQNAVAARGHTQKWARCIILGSPLLYHWQEEQTNPGAGCIHNGNMSSDVGRAKDALKDYSWDVVTCQPTVWGVNDEAQGMVNFGNVAKGKNPDVQVYHYQTWGEMRGNTYQFHWGEGVDKCWTKAYHEAVYAKVTQLWTGTKKVLMIPNGSVFEEIDKRIRAGSFSSMGSIWDCFTDECHLSDKGSFIVAMTCYAVIYRRDPSGIPPTGWNVTAAYASQVQDAVWDVVTAMSERTGVSGTSVQPAVVLNVRHGRIEQPSATAGLFNLGGRLVPRATGTSAVAVIPGALSISRP